MKMRELFLAVSTAAVLGLASILSACGGPSGDTPKDAVELSEASLGDIVVFGDIRWYVIAKTETGCTLLTEKPVIKMPFNEAGYQTVDTWDKSTVRAWLNEDFYNSKFSAGEKAAIVTAHNTFTADDSPYEMDCGNDTDDKVYLFTYTESKTVSDDIRGIGNDWWLRSPGKRQSDSSYILGRSAVKVRYSEQTD
jgi:hypothetical protein